jgi:hypothetical protein
VAAGFGSRDVPLDSRSVEYSATTLSTRDVTIHITPPYRVTQYLFVGDVYDAQHGVKRVDA